MVKTNQDTVMLGQPGRQRKGFATHGSDNEETSRIQAPALMRKCAQHCYRWTA